MPKKSNKDNGKAPDKEELKEIIQYAYDMHCLLVPDRALPTDAIADKNDIGMLHQRFLGFLKHCMEKDKVPLPMFALRWIGFNSAREFTKWKTEGTEEQQDFVDNIIGTLAGLTMIAVIEKQFNLIFGMFTLKTEYGKVEKGEELKAANQLTVNQQNTTFNVVSDAEVIAKLAEIRQSGLGDFSDGGDIVRIDGVVSPHE